MEQTLAIIKPDALASGKAGKILAHLEESGFSLRCIKMIRLNPAEAREFYAVHRIGLSLGPSWPSWHPAPVSMVLEAERAVLRLREVIGSTDPAEAAEGTVRKLFAESKERNAIHASDSGENALREIAFFFSHREILSLSP